MDAEKLVDFKQIKQLGRVRPRAPWAGPFSSANFQIGSSKDGLCFTDLMQN
jgi:hypothetical protein